MNSSAKVEELRNMAIDLATYDHKGKNTYEPALEQATSVIDSLINFVRIELKEEIQYEKKLSIVNHLLLTYANLQILLILIIQWLK